MGFLQDDHKGSLFQSDLWVGYPRHTFGEGLTLFHMFKTFIRDSGVFFHVTVGLVRVQRI